MKTGSSPTIIWKRKPRIRFVDSLYFYLKLVSIQHNSQGKYLLPVHRPDFKLLLTRRRHHLCQKSRLRSCNPPSLGSPCRRLCRNHLLDLRHVQGIHHVHRKQPYLGWLSCIPCITDGKPPYLFSRQGVRRKFMLPTIKSQDNQYYTYYW